MRKCILTIVTLILILQTQTAMAQTVALFGAQTCQNWLSEPAPDELGKYWILGSWSGLNLGDVLRRNRADTGHTLTAQDVLVSVERMCHQKLSMLLGEATARAWTEAKMSGQ